MKIHCVVCVALCQLLLLMPTVAYGGFYLTGALLYRAGSLNGELDSAVARSYRYNTNSADNGGRIIFSSINPNQANLVANQGVGPISFLLNDGDNQFSFSSGPIENIAGLSLFFTDTDTTTDNSHNPTLATGNRIGDLVVVTTVSSQTPSPTAGLSPAYASTGAKVQTYNGGGLAAVEGFDSSYSGANYFIQNVMQVTVTQFAISTSGNGILTLNVSNLNIVATPEPASLGACGLIACGAWRFLRKRKSGK